MRVILLRLLALSTAVIWLVAFGRAVPEGTASFQNGGFVPIAIVIFLSIGAALYSVVFPTGWGAIILFVTSALPAGFLAFETVWRFSEGGAPYVRHGLEVLSLPWAVCFIILPISWAAAYWSLRKAAVEHGTKHSNDALTD